jgi:hypothetical protein
MVVADSGEGGCGELPTTLDSSTNSGYNAVPSLPFPHSQSLFSMLREYSGVAWQFLDYVK